MSKYRCRFKVTQWIDLDIIAKDKDDAQEEAYDAFDDYGLEIEAEEHFERELVELEEIKDEGSDLHAGLPAELGPDPGPSGGVPLG